MKAMNQRIFIFFILLISMNLSAQENLAPGKYWIQLTDKKGSKYSISKPEAFLSAKALQRRMNQNIPIIENDLPVNQSYVDSFKRMGLVVLHTSKWLNGVAVECQNTEILDRLHGISFVTTFENCVKPSLKTITSKKVKESAIVAVSPEIIEDSNVIYGKALNQISLLNGLPLHKKGYRGEGMLIAVLDAGFYKVDVLPAFDSIWKNKQVITTRDFVLNKSVNFNLNSDHGMKVLSTIAANLPNIMIGTAPKANFVLLRSEDANSEYLIEESNWLAAAEFADSIGVDVINSSLGYSVFYDTLQNHKRKDLNGLTSRASLAAGIAASKGILVVNSAGNEGAGTWKYIGVPADAFNILTVGAVDNLGKYAYFSSIGPAVDGRVKPNVVSKGLYSTVFGTNGLPTTSSGTSFSSPIMAGMVTCLWQANPLATNYDVIAALERSATQSEKPDSLLGFGLPNMVLADQYLKSIPKINTETGNILEVYPNPFIDNVYVRTNELKNVPLTFELYNILGTKVYFTHTSTNYNEGSLLASKQLSDLAKGVYILKVTGAGKSFLHKLIKQ